MELLRKGKVKEVYDLDGEKLLFVFTDQISVFDKIIPSLVPKKGESLARTSTYWFSVANKIGIKNHFISLENGNRMYVKKFNIPKSAVTTNDKNYLIPLEFISRYYVAGSFYDRLKRGKDDFRKYGFRKFPEYGEQLPEPVFEATTKFEKTDRLLDVNEALKIGGLTKEELENIFELIRKMDMEISNQVAKRDLIHADGKKEFALDTDRSPYLVDTFGTADEDRWWDKKDYENQKITELSKEMVRQYYRSIGYYDELMNARVKGLNEPDIPPLPESMIHQVSELYVDLYERITGLKW